MKENFHLESFQN